MSATSTPDAVESAESLAAAFVTLAEFMYDRTASLAGDPMAVSILGAAFAEVAEVGERIEALAARIDHRAARGRFTLVVGGTS